jgi:hypothetical protein
MGWKVIIAPSARADLESIVRFIARQNSDAAAQSKNAGRRFRLQNPKSQTVNPKGRELLPLSLLNDFLYCPRRAALKAFEGLEIAANRLQ